MKPFATLSVLAFVLAVAPHEARGAAPMPSSRPTPGASVARTAKPKANTEALTLSSVGVGLTLGGLALGGTGTVFLVQAHEEESLPAGLIAGGCYVLGGVSLITGVTLWIVGASANEASGISTRVFVGPSRVGVAGSF